MTKRAKIRLTSSDKETPKVVIGLGYGNEGKGRTVDYLCFQNPNSIVVRFSGGQQVGHTVMTEDGKKHIFSNFGSGTLRGCPTYFSEHTTIYPLTILKEYKVLQEKGITPELVIHPMANLTTPFDVLANRNCKDNLSHGTCGLGVGKTMMRQNDTPYKLYAIDLLNPELLVTKLEEIKKFYNISYEENIEYVDKWLEALVNINWHIQDYSYLYDKSLIFEGSQGVLLDKDHGVFPHVTYANTTSKNAIEICERLGYKRVDVYGVTRTYSTRHGNGPFLEQELDLKNTEEETNVLNEYQGRFKVGMLDYDLLAHAIMIDRLYSKRLQGFFTLVVTCIDQYPEFKSELLDFNFLIAFDTPKNSVEINV